MLSSRIPPAAFSMLLAILFFLSSFFTEVGFAQKPESKPGKGPAFTVPPKKDPHYSLMGEFVGQIRQPGAKKTKRQIALQIRPVAGNQFHAIAYYGGLPGQPNHQSEEMRLIGLRSKNSVVLSGGPWAIFVNPQGCNIIAASGKVLGRLKRVHRVSPTLGAEAPEGATVLFDGSDVDSFVNAQMTENGLLQEGALISPMFQDFNLHVEFRLPYMPQAEGQQRANSGLYLQSRYECQVLDSFGTEKMYNGLGALYRTKAPDVNMAFPPLVWQTYDIQFTAPRWASDQTKVRDAHVTSWVNGVKVQDNVALQNKTGAGKPEAPVLLPINIQNHGDPVRFRNIWIIDRGLTNAKFPVIASKKQRSAAAKLEWNRKPKPKAAEKPVVEKPVVEPQAPKVEEKKAPPVKAPVKASIKATKLEAAKPLEKEVKKEAVKKEVKEPAKEPTQAPAKEEPEVKEEADPADASE